MNTSLEMLNKMLESEMGKEIVKRIEAQAKDLGMKGDIVKSIKTTKVYQDFFVNTYVEAAKKLVA